MSRIAVIGAGFAGIASAVVLAARGHAVTVLEARMDPGGVARRCVAGGAEVDLGPTMLVDLAPLSALCAAAGVTLEQTHAVQRLDPGLVARLPGAEIAFHAEPARLAADVARLGPEAASDWARALALGARAARLAEYFTARGDVRDPGDVLAFLLGGRLALGDAIPFARHASLTALLHGAIRTPALRTLLGHFSRFIGLDAAAAPSVALVIPYLLATSGVWYPRGGFSALARSLALLAIKHGAVLEMGDAVDAMAIERGHVREIRTAAGQRHRVDGVVAAVDARAAARWVGGDLARRVARLAPALAGRVAWWVVDGALPLPAHHAFDFSARAGVEPLYVSAPTLSDATLAPPGRAIVYALLHGAPGEAASPALGASVRGRLADAGWWPEGRVVAGGVDGGEASCYGYRIGAGLLRSFRVSPRPRDVANLVLAGGSVFPGPGVANVIRSGMRAATLIEAALGEAKA